MERPAGPTPVHPPAEEAPPPDLRAEAERAKEELARLREENLYLRAELENAGKRHARDKEEFRRSAAEGLIRALLEVRENLERAAGSLQEGAAADGVRMILSQLDGVLAEQGLEAIPAVGQTFDPFFHEAVERVPSPEPEGRIVAEVRKGYRLHKKMLRPALVKVSRGPDAAGGGRA